MKEFQGFPWTISPGQASSSIKHAHKRKCSEDKLPAFRSIQSFLPRLLCQISSANYSIAVNYLIHRVKVYRKHLQQEQICQTCPMAKGIGIEMRTDFHFSVIHPSKIESSCSIVFANITVCVNPQRLYTLKNSDNKVHLPTIKSFLSTSQELMNPHFFHLWNLFIIYGVSFRIHSRGRGSLHSSNNHF